MHYSVTFATGRRMFLFHPPVKTAFRFTSSYESNDFEDVSQLHVPAKPMPASSPRYVLHLWSSTSRTFRARLEIDDVLKTYKNCGNKKKRKKTLFAWKFRLLSKAGLLINCHVCDSLVKQAHTRALARLIYDAWAQSSSMVYKHEAGGGWYDRELVVDVELRRWCSRIWCLWLICERTWHKICES